VSGAFSERREGERDTGRGTVDKRRHETHRYSDITIIIIINNNNNNNNNGRGMSASWVSVHA
jgi:hypothetical protein